MEPAAGRYIRTQQPGPRRPLMVNRIALRGRAFIAPPISRIGRGQSPNSIWREQMPFDSRQSLARFVRRDRAIAERQCDQLIRTQRSVLLRTIDHIVKISSAFVPEKPIEALPDTPGE